MKANFDQKKTNFFYGIRNAMRVTFPECDVDFGKIYLYAIPAH